ncbi:MAG: hypothetical protein NTV88_02895, partial [Candidatus Micrarchaeota archaeon]|nr:hypothetical protein [Candidatus Micrarchaeota archaeon]
SLKNGRHTIGNLPRSPGKYAQLKGNLLQQMADELKSKKRIASLVEIAGKSKMEMPKEFSGWRAVKETVMPTDKKPIELAFSKTYSLLLGAAPKGSMDDYSEWLLRHTQRREKCFSCASGKAVHSRDYCNYFSLPKDRLLTFPESLQLGGSLKLPEQDVAALSMASAHKQIGKIAFFASEYLDGTNANLIECATSSDSNNCYRTEPAIYAKYCGYTFWPRSTAYAFGCDSLLDSEFCINCYHSVKLKRCFDMDSCRDCSDSYFCHNAENCRDCMFCFNVKNLHYAIGNVEVGREKFMEAKALLLQWINSSLSSSHDLKTDIYNVGCAKKKR